MARVLIVGCGCRGRALAASLVAAGHQVRGTSRTAAGRGEIDAVAGAEGVVADPDRLGTLLPALAGVSAACWLMGTARGEPDAVAALHGPRLLSMLDKVVDTPVRGVVYEAAGSVPRQLLDEGAASARAAAVTYRMPVRVVEADPTIHPEWLAAMTAAVEGVLTEG